MIERLGWTLVHFLWEGAAVAALLALTLLATRRAASNLRYGLALAALAVLAALPLATFAALAPSIDVAAPAGTPRWTSGETMLARAPVAGPMPLLVGVWAVGVVFLSLRLVGTLLHLERWRRHHARPADPEAQARLDALSRRLGLRRRVALFLSDRLEVPSAWGVVRPVVVLPASLFLGLAPAQAEAVLLHELAHIRRHDYLVNLLQSVVETALFYHPAVWWVSSTVRREREHVCDDLVVDALGDPAPYARALLLLEERRRAPRPALSAKEGKLMDRIARILTPRPAPVRLSPLAPALAALAVVGLALGGVLRAEAQAAPSAPPKHPAAASPPQVAPSRKLGPEEIAQRQTLEAQRNELEVQRILLMRKLAISQTVKGQADAALQRAMNARIHALKAQLDAARAQERALQGATHPKGVTYGAPGKGQHPLWSSQRYPQGVGRLVDPQAQDTRAFAEAQASLGSALAIGSSAQRTAARKAVDDVVAQQIAATTTTRDPHKIDLWDSKANTYRAAQAPELLRSTRQQVHDLYASVQAASADAAGKAASLQGQAKRGGSDPAEKLFWGRSDLRAFGKDTFKWPNVLVPNSKGLLDLQRRGAVSIPANSPFLFRGSAPLAPATVEMENGSIHIDADHATFADVIRALAKKTRLSVVVEAGAYFDVTVVCEGHSPGDTLAILCKAAHATYRFEGGVYYIVSKLSPAPSGGFGGFGGGGGIGG